MRILLVGLCFILLSCSETTITRQDSRTPSSFVTAPDGHLGVMAATYTGNHPSLNGIRVLDTGRDALIERAALIELAEQSIDIQYYIWNGDNSGRYLASRLIVAADRGVRVRLLLDDVNLKGRDDVLSMLDAHPSIEIRIYNPFVQRGWARTFNFLGEFTRLNRRMHNKSFTVDGVATIVGGRNIGDEYFDAHPELNFRDRDIVVIGPVVASVGDMFDTFWNATLSRDIDEIVNKNEDAAAFSVESTSLITAAANNIAALHGEFQEGADAARVVLQQSFAKMTWAPVRLVHDLPPEPDAVGDTTDTQPSALALRELALNAKHSITVESAYLVLDDDTIAAIRDIHASGIRVRILTNSLASNDVTANHAAYAKKRRQILDSGIDLYELRPDAASCASLIINAQACGEHHTFGLHAKTFVFDMQTVYVGSLNMNLRSRYLNAESGMIIENADLAQAISNAIELNMRPENSWQVVLDDDNELLWVTRIDGQPSESTREPEAPWSRRVTSKFIGLFPLEKYL